MKHFSVKAIIRADKQKQNGRCPIYIRVTIEKQQLKLPTPLEVEPNNWNTKEGIFKEAKSSVRNSALKKRVNEINDFILKQIGAENEITIELVKNNFTKQKNSSFYVLLDECYQHQFRTIVDSTKTHYLLVQRRLKEFNPNLSLNDLDHRFPLRFENFLIKKGIGIDGIWQHHKIVKVVINYGLKRKAIKDNPYLDFKVKRGEPRTETLTAEQIMALQDLIILIEKKRKNSGLELIRDMFLFSCYTALRFGDVTLLTKKNLINNAYISVIQEKTGSPVNIPLHPETLDIINKYHSPDRDTLFPYKSNQVCNRGLKRIAKMCGIDVNVHYHISRHSFGNVMASSGVNAFALSKLMGHSNMKTTMIYVNNNIDNVREQMAAAKIFRKL